MRYLLGGASTCRLRSLFSHISLTAQPFFSHFGFEIEKDRTVIVRGVALRSAIMRKTLAS
jgi:putative acetyltransferase